MEYYIDINIDIYEENGKKYVFLSHNGSSGCKYPFVSRQQLLQLVAEYAQEAVAQELDND